MPPATVFGRSRPSFGWADKRRVVARPLMIDVGFLPVPRQEIVEPAHGMAIGQALQDIAEIGEGLDVVELCSGDEGTNGGPACAAAVGACEQVVLASERDVPVILPMSARRSRSTTVGTRFTGAVSGGNTANSASLGNSFTSRRRPVLSRWWRHGCWIQSPAPR